MIRETKALPGQGFVQHQRDFHHLRLWPMLVLMTLRCEQCGHDNDSRYRFCGMCGAKLPPPGREAETPPVQPEPPTAKSPVQPVSGPSFLGLADEPSDPVSYLLEDEPASIGRGRYVIMAIFLAGIAAAGWYWRQDLSALASRFTGGQPAPQGQQTNSLAPAPAAASSSETQTAPGATPSVASPAPTAITGQAAPVSTTPASGSGTEGGSPAAQPPPATANEQPPATTAAPNSAVPSEASPSPDSSSSQQTSSPAPAGPVAVNAPSDNAAAKSHASADDTGDSREASAAPKSGARVKAAKSSTEQEPPTSESDALEIQGEKYLYGSGVPANCGLAQKSLLAAAERSNTKAQSVLGTMYATGHCASRDLPLAYRWFARALHQDPNNTRIQDDLKVLWSQMSADERQLALKAER